MIASWLAFATIASLASTSLGIQFEATFHAFATGAGPRGIALGDLDADGALDCVTANSSLDANSLSILRGRPGGEFAPAAEFAFVGGLDVALGHVDADAALDAVVALGASGVQIMRGDGAGGLPNREQLQVGFFIWRVWLAHVDGDATLDLVVLDIHPEDELARVGVLLGLGDASFAPVQWTATVRGFRDAAIGDTNGDGRMDVVMPGTAGPASGLTVFLGAGDGTFPNQVTLPLAAGGLGLALGQFDATPGLDVATYYSFIEFGATMHRVAIWTADGAGGFTRQADAIPEGFTWRIAAIDLDADGDDDLISLGARLGILRALGDGAFLPARPYDTGVEPWSVTAGDLNDDGRADLVVAANGSNCIATLNGKPEFDFGDARIVRSALQPQAIAAADFDADGRNDLALTSPVADAIALHRNLGNGTFANRVEIAVALEPAGLATGDVDANGAPDLVTATFAPEGANAVCVLRGTGALQFAPREDAALPGPATSVALADLDGDGDDDVITTLWTRDHPSDGEIAVLTSRGDGRLDVARRFDVGPLPWSVASGDLDEDGWLDLAISFRVTTTGPEGGVTLLFGTGDGGFGGRADLVTGIEPRGVVLADVDGDGHLDIAVAHSAFASAAAPEVVVLRGDGSGSFAPHANLAVGLEPHALVAADFDADGSLDLACANATAFTVSVLPGLGAGGFAPRIDLGAGARPRMLAVADVGGDMRPDLVVANEFGASASVLLNRSGTTPILFESITARRIATGVELHWTAPGVAAIDVERATAAAGPFSRRNAVPLAGSTDFFDPLPRDETAWYRLRAQPAGITSAPLFVASVGPANTVVITNAIEASDGTFTFGLALGAAATRIAIHDVAGRVVATLPHADLGVGEHVLAWDGRTRAGRRAPRGVYWILVAAGDAVATRRIVRWR